MSGRRASKLIQIDVFTSTFRLSGKIAVSVSGLVGVLGETADSNIAMKDIYASRATAPGKILGRYNNVMLPKSRIEMLILNSLEDMGPQTLAGSSARHVKRFYKSFITTPSYELHGDLEQTGKFDAPALLTGKGFVAMYDATAVVSQAPDIEFSSAVILVNRSAIDVVANNLIS